MKKLILVAVIGFLAVSAARGSKWFSYVRSEIAGARDWAKGQIPPEREIARLRSELKLLDRDVMTVVNQVARERVEVTQLKEQVDALRTRQSTDKELLQARAAAVKDAEANAETYVSFGNRRVGLNSAKAELEEGVRRFTANQKSLETLEATLAAREEVRDALEKQLEELKNQKQVLSASIDALEAQVNRLKLEQMKSKYQTDNTRLAKIKEAMRELQTKIDIEREKLKLMPAVLDAPASTPARSVDEIMAPLSGSKPAAGSKPSVIE
jgi:chromosome segregation ATPase